ncbi:MAG: PhzF family phenazine biosynthesis protein, partial [Thermoanaerobaculia bacterium]
MSLPIHVVDAFTAEPFSGNPAAVCPLPPGIRLSERSMQRIAAEMRHSNTAFLEARDGGWGLRWFTPLAEVALCGHATLASAHVLWESGVLAAGDAARFETLSGALTARRRDGWIELDFPERPEVAHEPLPELLAALGADAIHFGRNSYDFLVELATAAEVRALRPDFRALRSLPMRGVIVTARAEPESGFDFVSRFFAPGIGIDEDPVTGSAHCCLGPYWGKKLGLSELSGFQASERGGVVRVRVAGDRVLLSGCAVTVL